MLRKRLHTRLLGPLLTVAIVAAYASSASAGTYTVNSCWNGHSSKTTGWTYEATAGSANGMQYFYTNQDCSYFGFYRRFELTTIPAGAASAWTFSAPAGTWIDAATLHQTIVPKAAGAYDAVVAEFDDGSKRTIATYIGNTNTVQNDSAYAIPQAASHTIRLRTELGCQATGANCLGLWNNEYGNTWTLLGAEIRLFDPSLPAFTDVSGAGWTAQPTDGVLPINYSVTDAGAGISQVRFMVDGIEYDAKAEACVDGAYVPCPATSSGQFTLDTTRLSEGAHTVALLATDYARNETATTDKQLSITVKRPPAPAPSAPVSTSNPSWNDGGSPAIGDHLSGSIGGWSGSGNSYSYRWMRCDSQGLNCVPIDGATSVTYTPTSADLGRTLQFCVTATNSGGSATSCSVPTPAVVASHTNAIPTSDRSGTATPVSPRGSTGSTGSTGDRGAPNGTPASDKVVLSAVTNNRSSTQKVKFGKRVPITGRLVGPSGTPIGGAVLSVQVQTAVPGAAIADVARVVTGADGRFTYTAPAGPSRVIRFGYRAYTADSSFADTSDIRLLVAAGVTMRATPTKVRNRHATVFRGRLLGKPIAKRGVVVDLQVYFRKQWRTFAAPRTNKAGVYKFKYRFMAGAASWKFRARVRRDTSYPYELGYSAKPIKVKVVN